MHWTVALAAGVAAPAIALTAVTSAGAVPGSAASATVAGPTLVVSRDVVVPGDVVRTRALVRTVHARACSLVARRVAGAGRHTLGRAQTVRGVARWRVDTGGWRTGRWRLTATCRTTVLARTIRVVGPPGPAPASAVYTDPTITTTPALSPEFRSKVPDYVVACQSGVAVQVSVTAATGTSVSVDRAAWRSGTFTTSVALEPGQRFLIKVSGGGTTHTASVRCLPPDFPALTATGVAPAGWYGVNYPFLSGSRYLVVVDRRGTPVWWYAEPAGTQPVGFRFWTATELARFGWTDEYAFSWSNDGIHSLRRPDGTLVTAWGRGLSLNDHDLVPTARGTVYAIRYARRDCPKVPSECVDMTRFGGTAHDVLIDGEVLELDKSNHVLWTWSTRDHVPLDESADLLSQGVWGHQLDGSWDLVHINSVAAVPGGVLVSMRYTDAVYRVDRSSGDVTWKLGGTTTPESLTVQGSSVAGPPLVMQHDARRLTDGTVSVYDNGTGVRPPRMVRFDVDLGSRTATEVESVADARVLNSGAGGSARPLPGGRWLFAWGWNDIVTVNRSDGTPVFTLRSVLPNGDPGTPYQAVPIPPDRLPANALRAGMDAMYPRGGR